MKHISQSKQSGFSVMGHFRMPVTKHITYCHKSVIADEISNEEPTCDECIDVKAWEQIDQIERDSEGKCHTSSLA